MAEKPEVHLACFFVFDHREMFGSDGFEVFGSWRLYIDKALGLEVIIGFE
jgi:hypothetical protein